MAIDKTWKWLNSLHPPLKTKPHQQFLRMRLPWAAASFLSIIWGAVIANDSLNFYNFFNPSTTDNLVFTTEQLSPPLTFNISSVTALNLFGKVEITPSEIDPATLPNATTNLKLVGLLASSRPGASRSLISESGNPAKYYSEGDALLGNIKLLRIENDCVVVQRGDQLEKLSLPGSSIGKAATPIRSLAEMIKIHARFAALEAPPTVSKNEADKSAGPQEIYSALDASLAALQKNKKK